jgi:NitT/TauT family transport system substrate-binding protein
MRKCVYVLVLLIIAVAIGCENNKTSSQNQLSKITLQLNWTPDPTFAAVYIAADIETNYFAREGLEVDIQPGGFGIDPIAAVVSKKSEFAIVGADKAVVAFSNGAPIKVVAVDFQRNPVGWIVRKELGVSSIQDIINNNNVFLGDKVGTETTAILKLIIKRLNLGSKVQPQPVGFEFSYFIQHKNSVYPVYLNEEPITAKFKNIDVVEIDPSSPQNGNVRMYGNVIITHKDYAIDNREKVNSMIKALRAGWLYAKSYRANAISILKKNKFFDNEQMPCVLSRSVEFATSYYDIETTPESMDRKRWENTISTLREASIIDRSIEIDSLVLFP